MRSQVTFHIYNPITLLVLYTLHTRGRRGVVRTLVRRVLALSHPREGLPIMLHRLSRSHVLAGPFHLELLRAVTPPLVLVE